MLNCSLLGFIQIHRHINRNIIQNCHVHLFKFCFLFCFFTQQNILLYMSIFVFTGMNVTICVCVCVCVSVHVLDVFTVSRLFLSCSFSEEFSMLVELRSSQREESSVLTLLNAQHHIHLQLRLGPHSLTFISTQHREYEYVWPPVKQFFAALWPTAACMPCMSEHSWTANRKLTRHAFGFGQRSSFLILYSDYLISRLQL